MATIEQVGDALEVRVVGWDRIWALKSHLTIPLEHVLGARLAGEDARRWWTGLRLPGTSLPGVIKAGSFLQSGGWVFWDVHDPDQAIAIRLRDEHFQELIIQVDDPTSAIELINRLVSS